MSNKAPILLIEGDPEVGQELADALSAVGDVQWKRSAEEALSSMSHYVWQVIITAVYLPGEMNGMDFLRSIKSSTKATILVVSKDHSFERVLEAMQLGAIDFFKKPIIVSDVAAKVKQVLEENAKTNPFPHQETVLAIGSHPDDIEIACGGTIIRHHAYGDETHVLTLSNGAKGGDEAVRIKEAKAAADILGAELHLADLSDTVLSEGPETIEAINAIIDRVKPTVVYTHSFHDSHQDHRGVNRATITACRDIPRVYCYQAPSTSVDFKPAKFITIDAYIEEKLQAVAAFPSQTAIRDYMDEELLRSTARYWSRFSHAKYVEPFEVVHESEKGGRQ